MLLGGRTKGIVKGITNWTGCQKDPSATVQVLSLHTEENTDPLTLFETMARVCSMGNAPDKWPHTLPTNLFEVPLRFTLDKKYITCVYRSYITPQSLNCSKHSKCWSGLLKSACTSYLSRAHGTSDCRLRRSCYSCKWPLWIYHCIVSFAMSFTTKGTPLLSVI